MLWNGLYYFIIGIIGALGLAKLLWFVFSRPPKSETSTIEEGEDDGPYNYWP